MADRYWVGGAGAWNTTSTTNWSATSGGGGGASAPTSADNVFFDTASGSGLVTVTTANCANLTITATQSLQINTTTGTINCYGNFSLPATTSVTFGGGSATINFLGSGSFTLDANNRFTNGTVNFNAVGSTWTLSSIYRTTTINLLAGTLNTSTSNYQLNFSNFVASGSSVRALILNGSTVFCTTRITYTGTNFTFNAGTSNITGSSNNTLFSITTTLPLTFYNVILTAPATDTGAIWLGPLTFNNVTIPVTTSLLYITITISDTVTIGTLSLGSASSGYNTGFFISSNETGVQRNLIVNSLGFLRTVDFQDIAVTGTAAPLTGTALGNCGNNSGITFLAGINKYCVSTGFSGNYTSLLWSTVDNGTSNTTQPLPQDTAIFTNNKVPFGASYSLARNQNFGGIDFSSRTNSLTIQQTASSSTVNFFGNIVLSLSGSITFLSSSYNAYIRRGILLNLMVEVLVLN